MQNRIDRKRGLRTLVRQNLSMARRSGLVDLGPVALRRLREMTIKFGFSLAMGDFKYIDGGWYVTHSGLVSLASRKRCLGIHVQQVRESCDPSTGRWVFKSIVYKTTASKGFVGYGDADPTNTSPLVRGAEMRVAETRAVNRALRKAYGIGLCSVEELGSFSSSPSPTRDQGESQKPQPQNGSNNGHTRLRDRLCLLIREYNLDPTLVKAYAADFCGTETLKGASRDLVESFISHLSASAKENRDGLVCKLNSYAQPMEVKQ